MLQLLRSWDHRPSTPSPGAAAPASPRGRGGCSLSLWERVRVRAFPWCPTTFPSLIRTANVPEEELTQSTAPDSIDAIQDHTGAHAAGWPRWDGGDFRVSQTG